MPPRNLVIKQGWLRKSPTRRGGVSKLGNRQRRWFVLYPSYLEYWTDANKTLRKGTIELTPATEVEPLASMESSFFVSTGCVPFFDVESGNSIFHQIDYAFVALNRNEFYVEIHAKTEIECDNWIEAITRCVAAMKLEEENMFRNDPKLEIDLGSLYGIDLEDATRDGVSPASAHAAGSFRVRIDFGCLMAMS